MDGPQSEEKMTTRTALNRSASTDNPQNRLAWLDLSELTPPTTGWDQLAWLEYRWIPDYLDALGEEGKLPDGRTYTMHPARDARADRQEVARVFEAAFQQSKLARQKKILRSYATNFPHLAFDQDGWLWPLWQQWRSRYSSKDRLFLAALA